MEQQSANAAGDTKYSIITVKTVDGSTIRGKLNISSRERVSEVFTQGADPFIVLVDADTKEAQNKTVFVNKSHIVWVEPEE